MLLWLLLSALNADESLVLPEPGGTLLLPPSQWGMSPLLSVSLGILLTALTGAGLWLLNKTYNILPGPGAIYTALFLIAVGAMPFTGPGLTPSTIVALVTVCCTYRLFGIYGMRNGTMQCMLLFSILSFASMVQSACLLLIPVFLLGTAFLNACHLREFVASILGVIAPYWIVLGLGLAHWDQLAWRLPSNITRLSGDPHALMWLFIAAGAAGLIALMLMLYNGTHMLSCGVRHRAYYSFINLLAFSMVWFVLFDSAQATAYLGTLYLAMGLVATQSFLLSRSPRAWILPVAIAAIFLLISLEHICGFFQL